MADKDEDLTMPRDAKIVKRLMKSMGVEDYEPHVVHQFLELWYRYVVDVLTDAQVYSEHAGKSEIDCDDVKLAIQSKLNFIFSQPPPREVGYDFSDRNHRHSFTLALMFSDLFGVRNQICIAINLSKIHRKKIVEVLLELAHNRNKIPLPKSIAGLGVPLPPDQDSLISPNYMFAIPNKTPSEPVEETEDEEATVPSPSQEEKIDMQLDPPQTDQKVSFPLPKCQKD